MMLGQDAATACDHPDWCCGSRMRPQDKCPMTGTRGRYQRHPLAVAHCCPVQSTKDVQVLQASLSNAQ